MSNKMLWVIGIVAVILIAGVVIYAKSGTQNSTAMAPQSPTESTSDQTTQTDEMAMASASPAESSDSAATTTEGGVKEFTITGSSFKFAPAVMAVNKGDKVRVIFKNSGGTHDFVIDEFNVKTKTIPGGQEDTVEFTADKAGTFQYYCAVGNHRAMGMVGTLTVK